MERRSADVLRRLIAEHERQLSDFKLMGEDGLGLFTQRELTRLRAELAFEEFPERFGRRATDGGATQRRQETERV